jgi:hypothetical protein
MTLVDIDPWVFARLLSCRPVNGELELMSESNRGLARRLAAAPGPDRARIWGEYLAGLPDTEAAAAVEAIARVDPDSPPPEGEPWPPLRLGELPAVPEFPVEVLPDPLARLVAEAAGSVGCDPGMVAGPALAIAGGLIGRSASLLLGANWFAGACAFQINIGFPGDGKSPALDYAAGPVYDIDRELAEAFRADKQAYLDAMQRLNEAKRRKEVGGARPDPPVPRRINIDDSTMEATFRVLAANPRGLLMCKDELSSLILGLNQYKGGAGNDRPNLLKTWSGKPILIDRVLNEFGEPIRVPFPCLSITGNLPPAMLLDLVDRRGDDGLVDRWLFVFPDRRLKLKSAQRRPVSNEAVAGWVELGRRLWARPMDTSEGRSRPHVVYFSNPGKSEFDRLHDRHVDEVNAADFPDALRGPWSKLEEYAGRLCLILSLLRHAADPTADTEALPLVGPDVARDAWRLVGYFKSHHRRVRAYLEGRGLGGAPEGARLALRWIRNHPDTRAFPESELTRDVPQLRADRAALEDGLAWLAKRNVIRRLAAPDQPPGKRGRKPAPAWEVHPELSAPDNSEISGNTAAVHAPSPGGDHSQNCPNSPNPVGSDGIGEGE